MAAEKISKMPSLDAMQVAAGAILISFSPIFVAVSEVHPTAMAFYRVLIGCLAMGAIALWRFKPQALTKKQMTLAAIAGLAFSFDLVFWHYSIRYIGPGLATLLANGQVLVLAVVGVIFFKERLRKKLILAIIMGIGGLFLIVGPQFTDINAQFRSGIIFGLLTACAYSCYLLSLRGVQSTENPPPDTWTLFIASGITSLFIGIYALANHISFNIPDQKNFVYVLLYGLLCQGLGWFLISRAMPRVRLSLVGMLLLLQPLLAYMWDLLLFDRIVLPRIMIGVALTFLAIYLSATPGPR